MIDKNGNARLTGFGLASIVLGNLSAVSLPDADSIIATKWAAPEISKGGPVTIEGDVFAFAMAVAEVRTRGAFERGASQSVHLEQTFTERPLYLGFYDALSTGERPRQPATLSDDLWNLMQRCWNQEPQKRPTTFELVDFFRPS